MAESNHNIGKVILQNFILNQTDWAFYEENILKIFEKEIVPELNRICDYYDVPGIDIEIDNIEINIQINQVSDLNFNFKKNFLSQFSEQLERQINIKKHQNEAFLNDKKREQKQQYLHHFIESGQIPWHSQNVDLNELFFSSFEKDEEKTMLQLEKLLLSENERKRFLNQFSKSAIQKFVSALSKNAAFWQIDEWVYLLTEFLNISSNKAFSQLYFYFIGLLLHQKKPVAANFWKEVIVPVLHENQKQSALFLEEIKNGKLAQVISKNLQEIVSNFEQEAHEKLDEKTLSVSNPTVLSDIEANQILYFFNQLSWDGSFGNITSTQLIDLIKKAIVYRPLVVFNAMRTLFESEQKTRLFFNIAPDFLAELLLKTYYPKLSQKIEKVLGFLENHLPNFKVNKTTIKKELFTQSNSFLKALKNNEDWFEVRFLEEFIAIEVIEKIQIEALKTNENLKNHPFQAHLKDKQNPQKLTDKEVSEKVEKQETENDILADFWKDVLMFLILEGQLPWWAEKRLKMLRSRLLNIQEKDDLIIAIFENWRKKDKEALSIFYQNFLSNKQLENKLLNNYKVEVLQLFWPESSAVWKNGMFFFLEKLMDNIGSTFGFSLEKKWMFELLYKLSFNNINLRTKESIPAVLQLFISILSLKSGIKADKMTALILNQSLVFGNDKLLDDFEWEKLILALAEKNDLTENIKQSKTKLATLIKGFFVSESHIATKILEAFERNEIPVFANNLSIAEWQKIISSFFQNNRKKWLKVLAENDLIFAFALKTFKGDEKHFFTLFFTENNGRERFEQIIELAEALNISQNKILTFFAKKLMEAISGKKKLADEKAFYENVWITYFKEKQLFRNQNFLHFWLEKLHTNQNFLDFFNQHFAFFIPSFYHENQNYFSSKNVVLKTNQLSFENYTSSEKKEIQEKETEVEKRLQKQETEALAQNKTEEKEEKSPSSFLSELEENEENFEWQKEQYKSNPEIIFAVLNYFFQSGFLPWWSPYDSVEDLQKYFTQLIFTNYRAFLNGMNQLLSNEEISNLMEEFLLTLSAETDFSNLIKSRFFQLDEQFKLLQKTGQKENLKELESYRTAIKVLGSFSGKKEITAFLNPLKAKIVALWFFYWWQNKNFDFSSQNESLFFEEFTLHFGSETDVLLQQKIKKLLYLLKVIDPEFSEKAALIKTIVLASFSSLYGFDNNFIAQTIANWQRLFPDSENENLWEKLLPKLKNKLAENPDDSPLMVSKQIESFLNPVLFSDEFQNDNFLKENQVLSQSFVQLLSKKVYDFSLKLGLSMDEKTIQKISKTAFWIELFELYKNIEKNNFQSFQIWLENRREELSPDEKEAFYNWTYETNFFIFIHAVLNDFDEEFNLSKKEIWNEIVHFSKPQLHFVIAQKNNFEQQNYATERLSVWLEKTFTERDFQSDNILKTNAQDFQKQIDEIAIEPKILEAFFESPLFKIIQQVLEQLNIVFDSKTKEKITRLLLFFQKEISSEKMPNGVNAEKWMANLMWAIYWLFIDKKGSTEVVAELTQRLKYSADEAQQIVKSANVIVEKKQKTERPISREQEPHKPLKSEIDFDLITKTLFENASLKKEIESILSAFNMPLTAELKNTMFLFWETFWLKSNAETSFFKQKSIKWQAHAIWLLLVLWYKKSSIELIFEFLKTRFSVADIIGLKNWAFRVSNQNVLIQIAPFFDNFQTIESDFENVISNELGNETSRFYDEKTQSENLEDSLETQSENEIIESKSLEKNQFEIAESENDRFIQNVQKWPIDKNEAQNILDNVSQKMLAVFPEFNLPKQAVFETQIQLLSTFVFATEDINLLSNASQIYLASFYAVFSEEFTISESTTNALETLKLELSDAQKLKIDFAKTIVEIQTKANEKLDFNSKVYLWAILNEMAKKGTLSELISQKIVEEKTLFNTETQVWLKSILVENDWQKLFDESSLKNILSAERTAIIQQTSAESRREILQEVFEEIFTQKQYDYTLLQDWNYWLSLWENSREEKLSNEYLLQAYLNELAINDLQFFAETAKNLETQNNKKIAEALAKQQKAEEEGKFETPTFSIENLALEVLQFEMRTMDEKNLVFLENFPLPGINFLYNQTESWISKLIKTLIDKAQLETTVFEKWQNIYLPNFKRINLLQLALSAFFKEILIFKTIEKKDIQQLVDAELMPKAIKLFIENALNEAHERLNTTWQEITLDKSGEKNIFIQSSDKNRKQIAEILSNEQAGITSIEKLKSFINEVKKPEIKEVPKAEYEAYDWGEKADTGEKIYINNAGLVLIWPFLSGFFKRLGLVEKGKFIDEEKREKAIHLSQYLVDESTNNPEYNLLLNKLICGLEINQPLERFVKISEEEKQEANLFLEAIKNEWKQMQKTSLTGFRETFLQREGYLYKKADNWFVKVEWKSFDVLLMTVPWGYTLIRLPWNKEIIYVEWTTN